MRLLAAALLTFVLGCASASSQPASPLQSFAGSWRGEGQFQNAPSQVNAVFAPLFRGAAWTLDIEVRFTPQGGETQLFQGRASYALRDGALAGGSWIDSGGQAYAIAPRLEGGALIVTWGSAQVSGRSEYRLEQDGDLHIEDLVQTREGEWRSFATADLQRAP